MSKVDEKKQIVFRSSEVKTKIAAKMSSATFLAEEFCHFDGKVNRTKHFTTLTALCLPPFITKTKTLC